MRNRFALLALTGSLLGALLLLPGTTGGAAGAVRPDIVWFGEMPYEMDRIDDALREADLFVSIGTSGRLSRSVLTI